MSNIIYRTISAKETAHLDIQPQGSKQAEAFVNAFLKNSLSRLSAEQIQTHLHRKAVILEHVLKRRKKQKRRKAKCLSAKERRELRIFELKPEEQRYELFLPLHELWKQYIRDLCNGFKPDMQTQTIQTKLMKADFHGAIVTVIPKQASIFSVEIDGFVSYIYGSKFQLRSSERSAKKFKGKGSIDL
ncbi:ribonuclease P protein subunit p29 isoform X2 [Chiloscyllium punctatum]|uniref:ribonuclease P protein subunit p29 isoform X2 n=1 Tax=Chiloscyllium punctatum TaxID=137246 RepID=UPI003B63BA58